MAFDHMPARLRHFLRTSSDERHQNRPYSDQTKRHPGSSYISAHRPSPSLRRMAIAPASRCDQMVRQPRLRCRCVHLNKKKASGVPRLRVEEKDLSGNEKAGSGAGLSHHTLRCGLAVGARIAVWREEPSAVTRLGEVGVHRLPVSGPVGSAPVRAAHTPARQNCWLFRTQSEWFRDRKVAPSLAQRCLPPSRLPTTAELPPGVSTTPRLPHDVSRSGGSCSPLPRCRPTVRGQPRVQSRRSHNKGR